ncbi:hypothetical protein ACIBAC_11540 [Streptomyces sp. NPDC051362]|uniref:hypothetical protein n=1 Tax=Streptomyces sp. NPDC051362 TaxID=3365651 RepID=UPI0037A2BEB3
MPDYSNPSTPLTARNYAWSATAARPPRNGAVETQKIDGSYSPPPGATVGTLRDGLRHTFAAQWGVPVSDVTIVSYTIREK